MSRIGIVGTGFIAMGLCMLARASSDLVVSRMLTRRQPGSVSNVDPRILTSSINDLVENCDLVVECSGDLHHAAQVVDAAMQAGLPVVTMGAEFHVTVGSYFCQRGIISEAEGDQPGSLAALHEEVTQMGFNPLAYGNIKGFLNHHPTPEEAAWWAKRNGINVNQVISFTDGTKVQIEQALVANGLGADIIQQGMLGPKGHSLEEAAQILGEQAKQHGRAISEYLLNGNLPAGVFIVAEHLTERPEVLRYLKMGEGPYYSLLRPYHLCHLEIPRTIRRILAGGSPLLNNSANPTATVVAIAKRDLPAGYAISSAIGSVDFRGEAATIAAAPSAAPIGLLTGARLRHSVSAGQVLQLSDVEIPDSLAKKAWESVHHTVAQLAA